MSDSAKTYALPLKDKRKHAETPITHPPTVHIARGFEEHLPFLKDLNRPLICISDWQFETTTQEHFWEQAVNVLNNELGGPEALECAIVLVAGDMASCGNALRGPKSDDAPRLHWLQNSVPRGSIHMLYGNHCHMAAEHLQMTNPSSGTPCLLPHGGSVSVPLSGLSCLARAGREALEATRIIPPAQTSGNSSSQAARKQAKTRQRAPRIQQPQVTLPPGLSKQERKAYYERQNYIKLPKIRSPEQQSDQWRVQNPEQAHLGEQMQQMHEKFAAATVSTVQAGSNGTSEPVLRIGAVHGIPASYTKGLQKIEREEYFAAIGAVCSLNIDILVTHTNPRLPVHGEHFIQGPDAPRLYEEFIKSPARLLVHGHMHTEPVVSVLEGGNVVVNSDCRVVAFAPPTTNG